MTEEQKTHIELMKACVQALQKEKPLVLKGGNWVPIWVYLN